MTSLKIVTSLAVAILVVAGLTFGAMRLTSKSGPTHPAPTQKTPGVALNLIACGSGQTGVECIALYKNACVVIAFDPSSGQPTGAQPAEAKYCGTQ